MEDLVQRLFSSDHPVTAGGPNPSAGEIRAQIERGCVFVKFTGTQERQPR